MAQSAPTSTLTLTRRLREALGFSNAYNFALFIVSFSGLMGFTLYYHSYLNPDAALCSGELVTGSETFELRSGGECYYFLKQGSAERVGIWLHILCVMPAAFLACWQFVPVVRRRFPSFHRYNGYVVLALSYPGTVGGFMMTRRALGGSATTQITLVLYGVSFLASLTLAQSSIKRLQIDQHRAWMIRAWAVAGAIATIRPIMFTTAGLVSFFGDYYSPKQCRVIEYMLEGAEATLEAFPGCEPYFSGENPDQQVAVKANAINPRNLAEVFSALDIGFGVGSLLALILVVVLAEIYLQLTPDETRRLQKASYMRQLAAGIEAPRGALATSDQFGDDDHQSPKKSSGTGSEYANGNGCERPTKRR